MPFLPNCWEGDASVLLLDMLLKYFVGTLSRLADGVVHGCDSQLLFSADDTPMIVTYQGLYLIAYFDNKFLV